MGNRFGIWDVADILLLSPIPISFLISNNALLYSIILHYTSVFFISIMNFFYLNIYHFICSSFFSFIFFHIYSFFPSYNSFYITSFFLLSLHSLNSSSPSHTYLIYILFISISLIWPYRAFRFSLFSFLLRSRLLSCSRL